MKISQFIDSSIVKVKKLSLLENYDYFSRRFSSFLLCLQEI